MMIWNVIVVVLNENSKPKRMLPLRHAPKQKNYAENGRPNIHNPLKCKHLFNHPPPPSQWGNRRAAAVAVAAPLIRGHIPQCLRDPLFRIHLHPNLRVPRPERCHHRRMALRRAMPRTASLRRLPILLLRSTRPPILASSSNHPIFRTTTRQKRLVRLVGPWEVYPNLVLPTRIHLAPI